MQKCFTNSLIRVIISPGAFRSLRAACADMHLSHPHGSPTRSASEGFRADITIDRKISAIRERIGPQGEFGSVVGGNGSGR